MSKSEKIFFIILFIIFFIFVFPVSIPVFPISDLSLEFSLGGQLLDINHFLPVRRNKWFHLSFSFFGLISIIWLAFGLKRLAARLWGWSKK
ncbi:MAG: hypothetical protein COU85_01655 [Candidatus Portnoybacteria bacterium CG10_big_fil_rev_8_21_14_0_10_44_7]|uniref:Uncharacterized protein n=1 Tax=Candidatus Portnoybacteria bacterium CG10_big_fil_rev_8_21_14_0_10_44_7 TaxID=1974816 RepID=A0A2M8KIS6_9BACT|nr:MAG: hypothetical protein COU85_01655 [Candidatus Portnoybacteria bacterium CG10_big_fil_rev_8_21_14_0_10_44_7]